MQIKKHAFSGGRDTKEEHRKLVVIHPLMFHTSICHFSWKMMTDCLKLKGYIIMYALFSVGESRSFIHV